MKRAQNPSFESGRPRSGRSLRRLLDRWIRGGGESEEPRRGRLLLESLEQRQLLAGDMDLLFTDGQSGGEQPAVETSALQVSTQAEGEPAPDLVQFAKDLVAADVKFYGAAWCPFCTEQKELFEDGGDHLNMIEVTDPAKRVERLTDQSVSILNSIGQSEGISSFPTWVFPDNSRAEGVLSLQELSQRSGVPIPQSEDPTFKDIGNLTVQIGSPLHVPVDAYDPNGGPLAVTVTVQDPTLLTATVLQNNRSIRVDMQGYGDMVYELFDQRAPTAAGRVATLAAAGFYDDILFHRITSNFVLQWGDPTATGTSGSTLGPFDDDFHPDLQHNREGVLSYAKSADDTNNSQIFVTETPTRFLDFNHSVIGQLVEGFDVREAISDASTPESRGTGSSQKPDIDVAIDTIEVFNDTENSLVMLKPTGNGTGTTNVTFTVTDLEGNTHSETVQVAVVNDTFNSQPFLNPVTPPATTPVNTAAQLQLSSIDVEGDAVTYFAQSLSSSANGTVSVDPTSGLVTVTPANGFSGTINVNVGVRPGPGVVGNGSSDQDTQRVAFTFEGETALPPTFVDLDASSDSGTSSSDNITNEGSLSFLVGGVSDGATVEIINTDGGAVIGTGLATGSTITITTNNIAALGDGTYQLAARQTIGNETSTLSPTLTIQYDTTAPESVTGSALTQANVGRDFITDLISSEEGSGLVYALSTSPTGATIDADNGIINWTPASGQLGANTFTLELTDAAGNTRSESFTVNVAAAPLAEVRLDVTDLQGNPITSLAVGQEFLLNVVAVDARSFNKPGVFAAYADVLFDSQLVRPVSGSSVDYNDQFTLVRKGTFLTGLIDEVGAVNSSLVATQRGEDLIAKIRMEAVATGTVTIRSEPADETDSEFLLYGEDDQIPAESIAFGGVTLAVGQSFTVGNDTLTVAEDSGATVVDVLANDQVISGNATLAVVSVTQPSTGGTVTRTGNTVRFTPAADFFGSTTFTYLVGDTNGVQETGTVSVTVTPVNDAPTANDETFNVNADSTGNTLSVLANDSIAPDSGETLTVTAVGQTSNGGTVAIANGSQAVVYTPPSGFTGTDTFTYTISDGELTDTATATVTVAPADDPPTARDDVFDTLTEDDGETSLDVRANDDRDVNDQTFVVDSVGSTSNGGTVRVSSDGTTVLYTPAPNFNGNETFTYTIRDTGGGLSVATATVTVAAVNDPPPVDNGTVNLNRATGPSEVFSLDDLPSNVDSGETLEISDFDAQTTAGGSIARINNGRALQYTLPSADFVGTDTFTVTISDGVNESTATVTVNVTDFSPRRVILNLPFAAARNRIDGVRIVGTNQVGDSVNQPIAFDSSTAFFGDLLPGDYTIEIPAIPFLQGGDEPRQIAITSNPDDGDVEIDAELGRLKPEFVSIRDWLGSTTRNAITVVVEPGSPQILSIPTSEVDDPETPVVQLDTDAQSLTIVRTIEVDDGNGSTVQEQRTATLPLDTSANVDLRGVVDQTHLVKIDFADVTFVPTSNGSGEGESVAAGSLTAAAQGEGEAAAESTSQIDVTVPASVPAQTTSAAAVLVTEEGDLWFDENVEPETKLLDAVQEDAVDSAMQDVADGLVITESAADQIAEDAVELDQSAIDELLSDA